MNARIALTFAAALLAAMHAGASFVYTETNATETAVINGKSDGKGTLTDGVWTFGAIRPKGTTTLKVYGTTGTFSGSEASPINLTEIVDGDGATYQAIYFETLSHYNGASKSTLYAYKDKVTAFIAPDCETIGGNGCFLDCTELTNVVLSSEISRFAHDRPFKGCTKLAAFSPRTLYVTSLPIEAFSGCSALTGSFELPNCTSLATGKNFQSCALLESITATNVTYVGESVFNGCSALESVSLSPSLTTVKNYAFNNCASIGLESVMGVLHKNLQHIGSNDSNNMKGIFLGCSDVSGTLVWNMPGLATNVVPNDCFKECASLDRVEFKTSVAEIRDGAFYNIKGGAEVYFPSEAPVYYGSDAVSRGSAPYPKVYLKDNFDEWFAVMTTKHHLILRADFTNTTWSSTYGNDTKGWSVITGKMRADTEMCDTETVNKVNYPRVLDNDVIAFVMRGNNTGCWVLSKPAACTMLMIQ